MEPFAASLQITEHKGVAFALDVISNITHLQCIRLHSVQDRGPQPHSEFFLEL